MNPLRAIFAASRPALGTWVNVPSPVVIEALAAAVPAGLDFVLVDAQHAAFGPERLEELIRSADGAGLACVVRVGVGDHVRAELLLDLGAAGIVFPCVNSAAEARAAAGVCRYPPAGTRSFGGLRALSGRGGSGDERDAPVCVVQIETGAAAEAAAEILCVPGVDVVFPGPVDLAWSLGLRGSYATFQEISLALAPVLAGLEETARGAGVGLMRHAETPEAAQAAAAAGCSMITFTSDAGLLGRWASPLRAPGRGAA